MSTDILNTYFDKIDLSDAGITTALTHASVAADKSDGQGFIDHGGVLGRGPGIRLWLIITINAVLVGPSTVLTFLHEQADDAAFTVNKETLDTFTTSIALAPAGEIVAQTPLHAVSRRYTRVSATWSTTATAGLISASLSTSPQHTFND